jgi:sodium/potassium-transporting ATPase subunit alpha
LLSIEEIPKKFDVKFDANKPSASAGLSLEEAKKRLALYGQNRLSPPKKVHPLIQFGGYMLHIFNVMLWAAGVASYIAYFIQPEGNFQNVYLGAIFIVVAFLNAGIEFYQTAKSQAILESFLNLIPAKCYTIRETKLEQTDAVDLVYGDIVYIRSGDKIPADLLIIHATDLKVDNSSLTGEAEPQERGVLNTNENPLEARNLVFNGTLCVNGDGYGLVVRTGDNTVIGQIAFLTSSEDRRESPMNQEINIFVYLVASVAAVVAIAFFIVSMTVRGNSFAVSLNFAIGTFVSFVPEGLPATLTVLLTLAAKSMAARNVLVKDLQGVETLGAITLLATDKTGTLTRNQMTVTYIWAGNELFFAMIQSGNDPSATLLDVSRPAPNEVLHMSLLCSRARFEAMEGPISTRPILGDATESGLLRNAAQKLDQYEKITDLYPKVCEVPFNSDNKWAMTIHKKKHANGFFMLYLKGAPERVLRLCSTFHDGTNVVPLTEQHKADFDKMYNFMASKGHRVLAFSALALPQDEYPENFEFKKDPANYPTVSFLLMFRKI